nr:putative reverse transcriptase domain-containing protein [Tanacetum cinerariifolium]
MAFLSSPGNTNKFDTANIQVSTISTPVSIVSSHDNTAYLSNATVYAFLANQPNGSQLMHEELEQIHEDDLEEMDLKWQLALLSMRETRYFQRTGKKIIINGSDSAGYDKTKVECFNCYKMGHFARECRSRRNQESRPRNQDSSRKTINVEDTSSKAMVAIDGAGFNWSYMTDDEVSTNMALMAFSDLEETSPISQIIKNIMEDLLHLQVVLKEFCKIKGIKRVFSNARTPQQNGVAERKNMTLIEAARTMVLVTKPHNKTPYELFIDRTPIISFMRPFGYLVTILNTLDHLGQAVKEKVLGQKYILLPLLNTCSDVPSSHEEIESSPKDDAGKKSTPPEYVPESDFEAHPEDDDDEDPEEDPEESSEDDEDDKDDEMDIEAKEEEEEHPAPTDSVVVTPTAADQAPSTEEIEPFETDESVATPPHPAYRTTARISILAPVPMPVWTDSEVVRLLSISSPPASPLSTWSSPSPQIPFPPLPPILSPPSPILSPAPPPSPIPTMIRLRDEADSTSHSPPLQLPSASHREDRPEVTLPHRKRPAGGFRADYDFVATVDKEIMQAIEIATELMDKKILTFAERETASKRKFENTSRNTQNQQQHSNKRKNIGRVYTAASGEKKQYVRSRPLCAKCNYHHDGPCAPKCCNCNKIGHSARDCRGAANTNNANNQRGTGSGQKSRCYECRVQGHFKRECPKLKNYNNQGNQSRRNSASARVYAVGHVGTDPDANVVMGTFFLNNRYSSILFDTGADRSFVSTTFSTQINITPSTLDHCYDVELADGRIIRLNTILRGCTLNLLKHPFNIDLMPVDLEKYVKKGFPIFLAHITTKEVEDKSEKKRLEDVPIVRDFPEVFPEDLSGLPLTRPVEFQIDLVPGAALVARALYRLAPSEMKELVEQLKELSDKGFIRPSSSPWGAPVLISLLVIHGSYKGYKEGLWNEFAKLEASMKMWESLVEPRHSLEKQGRYGTFQRTNDEWDFSTPITVNAASSSFNHPTTLYDYSKIPNLEDTGIFNDAYDDRDEGAEADYDNLETEISIRPIPSTRIHKDHPKEQITGEFKLLNVWTLVDLPYGKRAIGTKWVYRNMRDQRGIVVRNKSKLVAQGHRQEEGIDYDEVFAPVARIKAIRVYKLEKALHGLHQAPRAWYETLSTYVFDNGFRRGTIDKTLFIKQIKNDIRLVQVFQMSYMGELTFFLGLHVKQRKDGIFLSPDKDVCDILKKFGFLVSSQQVLQWRHTPLSKDADGTDVDVHLYRHAVKRIFRYLKGQPTLGLWYPKDLPLELIAYSASLDRKSTMGGCQFLGSRLISWQCKKQAIMANSTTEAEYIAASNCCGQCNMLVTELILLVFSILDFINTTNGHQFTMSNRQETIGYSRANGNCPKTINLVKQIHAIVDGKVVVISESSVRSDILFDDEDGMDTGGSPRHQETMQGTSAQTRSERVLEQPNEPPLTEGHTFGRGYTPGCDEGRLKLVELMHLCTTRSNIDSTLENELSSTKAVYHKAFITFTNRVKKLETQLKQKRSRAVIHSSNKEEPSLSLDEELAQKLYAEELAKEAARQEQKKPFSKAKVRKNMVMYLKNQEGYKQSYFKGMKKDIMKRSVFHLQQESSKKQKLDQQTYGEEEEVKAQVDSDQEVEEMKLYMRIVPDEDIVIDAIPLVTKPPMIVK